jgi:hypothetical protein
MPLGRTLMQPRRAVRRGTERERRWTLELGFGRFDPTLHLPVRQQMQ